MSEFAEERFPPAIGHTTLEPVAPVKQERNVLFITRAQLSSLEHLPDEDLRRLQSAFDALIYLATKGLQ